MLNVDPRSINPLLFEGLKNIRIPVMIPSKGRGLLITGLVSGLGVM